MDEGISSAKEIALISYPKQAEAKSISPRTSAMKLPSGTDLPLKEKKKPVSKRGSTMGNEHKAVTRKESSMSRSVTSSHQTKRPVAVKRPMLPLKIDKSQSVTVPKVGNALASPRSPGKGQGIGGLIASMRDVEQRIEVMEAQQESTGGTVGNLENAIERLKEQQNYSGNQIEGAYAKCDDVKRQMDEMTGGASNLAAFMQKVGFERDKTNKKLERLIN